MKAKRRMTASEFEAVRPLLDISNDRVAAARLALVDGQTLQSAADGFGWTRQNVDAAVSVVWRTFERYKQAQQAAVNASVVLPPGWEQVTVIAPSGLVQQFRAEIAKAVQAHSKKEKARRR